MPGEFVKASQGQVPDGAVQGGYDGDVPLFVARARMGNYLIPGKLHPGYGLCYVAYDEEEHAFNEYEVLCNSDGEWVPISEDGVPEDALPAGKQKNEYLYIGRAYHENTLTPGKIHISHQCCYIPYGGLEICYEDCEVFLEFGTRPGNTSEGI